MLTINDYLDNILEEFEDYVYSGVRLCDLKSVHFDAGKIPDYSNIHVQQLYLLRYAYAYSFEYKCMYRTLLDRTNFRKNIAVTSIGCGSMLDYWALANVVPRSCEIRSRGIDTIDWAYQMEARVQDDVRFIRNDAIDCLFRAHTLSSDVYIFPKSISEFPVIAMSKIGKLFGEKTPMGKTVFFMFSLRTDRGSMERDVCRTKALFGAMLENGFRSSDDPNMYCHFSEDWREKKIKDVDEDFHHPWRVVDFLKEELHSSCIGYSHTGEHCEDDCKRRLSWWPILTCKQAHWQIFEFRKEA